MPWCMPWSSVSPVCPGVCPGVPSPVYALEPVSRAYCFHVSRLAPRARPALAPTHAPRLRMHRVPLASRSTAHAFRSTAHTSRSTARAPRSTARTPRSTEITRRRSHVSVRGITRSLRGLVQCAGAAWSVLRAAERSDRVISLTRTCDPFRGRDRQAARTSAVCRRCLVSVVDVEK